MANTARMAILQAKVEGVLTDLMVRTDAKSVVLEDGTTLAAKLTQLTAEVASAPTAEYITAAIAALRTELMGEGVPEAYDTFKELAEYIESHKKVADALEAAIGDKADKTSVDAIQQAVVDLTSQVQGAHTHENKTVLDTITADRTALWDAKTRIFVAPTAPENMGENDLLFKLV